MRTEQYHIILIDDDQDELEFLAEAIEKQNLPVCLHYYKDYYHFASSVTTSSLPDLLVVDINLPLLNGIEALKEIKASNALSGVPAVTFTSSTSEKFISESEKAGALKMISKPATSNGYLDVANQLYQLCHSNQLPAYNQTISLAS